MESNNKFEITETDAGYSERKLDSNTDLQAGQWLDLRKGASKTISNPQVRTGSLDKTRLQKLKSYSLDLIRELEAKVGEIGENSVNLKEVERLQSKLQVVLRAIQFEQKGSLDISKLPKEVQDLVK